MSALETFALMGAVFLTVTLPIALLWWILAKLSEHDHDPYD